MKGAQGKCPGREEQHPPESGHRFLLESRKGGVGSGVGGGGLERGSTGNFHPRGYHEGTCST